MNEKKIERLARRRGPKWVDQLTDNSSLRDNLPDEQATQLLNWGLAQVKAAVTRHVDMPADEAAPLIEKDATAVKLIMQGVNDLMGGIGQPLTFDLIDDTMTRLLKNHRWLTERPLTTEQVQARTAFNEARTAEDRDAAFVSLMALIQIEPPAVTPTPDPAI
jgi:hypothetical protein